MEVSPPVPLVVDACIENTFEYRSPVYSENCPSDLFFPDSVIDPLRADYAYCEDLPPYKIPDWIHYDDPLAIALYTVTACIQIYILVVIILIMVHRLSPVVRMSSVLFCCYILFGALLMTTTVYFLGGEPNDDICRARAWFFCTGFALMFTSLFAKTLRLHIIIRKAHSFRRVKIPDSQLTLIVVAGMSPTIILLILW